MAASSCKCPAVSHDRLSALPDCLLHTVMSFLTAQQAVQTCVLSRSPGGGRAYGAPCRACLDIDEREFCAWVTGSQQRQPFSRFEDLVNNLLVFHGTPSLDRFRIDVDEAHESRFLDLWIRRGIKGCPRVVEIRVWNRCINSYHVSVSVLRASKGCIFLALVWTTGSHGSSRLASLSWKIWCSSIVIFSLKKSHPAQ